MGRIMVWVLDWMSRRSGPCPLWVQKAALTASKSNFRFTPESGLGSDIAPCPKSAIRDILHCRIQHIIRSSGGDGTAVLIRVQSPRYRQVRRLTLPRRSSIMDIDRDHIDDAVLALLFLGRHDGMRTWKSFDWAAMERLHAKGLISDPVGKAKSVVFTDEGLRQSEALFRKLFTSDAKHEARYS